MNATCKRIIDVILSGIGLIIAGPLMALISLLLWIDSPGNVIFAQERLGRHGTRFRMFKFRKFPPTWGEEGPGVTTSHDPRMTTLGAILERTKLDELPQLWNILRGEMSFVGPRPETIRFADLFAGEYAELLNYSPGVFGPSQALFRNESELYPPLESPEDFYRRVLFREKAERDLRYFRTANCFQDIRLILKGIWATMIGTINWQRFLSLHGKTVVIDLFLIVLAWFSAHLLRFADVPSGTDRDVMYHGFVLIPPVFLAGLAIGGCYNYPLVSFSLSNAIRLSVAVCFSSLLSLGMLFVHHRSISFYLAPLLIILSSSFLVWFRVFVRERQRRNSNKTAAPIARVMIYGAGTLGQALSTLLEKHCLLGFLDDDAYLKGSRIRGYAVLGHEGDMANIHQVKRFDELWVTFRLGELKRRRLTAFCDDHNVRLCVISDLEPFARLSATACTEIASRGDVCRHFRKWSSANQ